MNDGVPSTYDEMVREYQGYIEGLLRQLGVRDNRGRAQDLMLRLFSRDILSMYDPSVTGHGRPTNFKAFVRGHVVVYARHYIEQQGIDDYRQPVILDRPASDGTTLLVELMQTPAVVDMDAVLRFDALVDECRDRLSELEPLGKRDLVRLFDVMASRVAAGLGTSRKELAAELGLSTSVVGTMLSELSSALEYLAA